MLGHLKRRFSVLPLADGVERLYDGTLPASALAVTFDDGYADNLAVAAPLLRKHGVPATLFIATGYVDGGAMWNDIVIEAFRDDAPAGARSASRSISARMRSDRRSVGDWRSTTCWAN